MSDRMVKAWVDLCLPISQANNIFISLLPLDLASVTQLRDLYVQIQRAYEALPIDLIYNGDALTELNISAHAYHMQFYSFKVVLHRSFIRYFVSQGGNVTEDAASVIPTALSPASSRKICMIVPFASRSWPLHMVRSLALINQPYPGSAEPGYDAQ